MTVKICILPVYPEKVSNDERKELRPPPDYVLVSFLPFVSSASVTNNCSLKDSFFPRFEEHKGEEKQLNSTSLP